MGALLNEKAGSGMAKGIGIQVLKDGSPLQFNKKYTVGRLNNQGDPLHHHTAARAFLSVWPDDQHRRGGVAYDL